MSSNDLWDEEAQGPDPFQEELPVAETEETPADSLPAEEAPVEEEPAETSEAEPGTAEDGAQGDDEGAPAVEGDAEPPTPELSEEEETWRRRYEGLRNARENSAAELAREREARLQVEQAARQLLEMEQQRLATPPSAAPPAPTPEPTDAELLAAGFESRDQYRFLLKQATAAAQAEVAPHVEQLTAQQQQMAQQMALERQRQQQYAQQQQTVAEQEAVTRAVLAFGEEHTEFRGDSLEAQGLRDDFDRTIEMWNAAWNPVDEHGNPIPGKPQFGAFDASDIASLEVAAEATKWPALADVLTEQPGLFESQRGLELARIQARLLDAERGTPTKTPKVDSQAVDARLKAAHTEPGSSGSSQAPKTPEDKEWDEVEAEWQTASKSIFS